jgi:CRP-like cAMP-binding protein
MSTAENHLFELLPRAERTRLLATAEPQLLRLSAVLCEANRPTQHVFFPVDAFISLITPYEDHAGLEVGMVGREGMLGMHLGLGVSRTPWRAVVQGPGLAWRLDAATFRSELVRSTPLRRLLHRYIQVRVVQLAGAAACLRYHLISPRLARWLLMSHDRAQQPQFHVTHEFLAYMLGVRRVGVTVAAGGLQRAGLIHYHRGELTVIDRPGLESMACSCYAKDKITYAELLGR